MPSTWCPLPEGTNSCLGRWNSQPFCKWRVSLLCDVSRVAARDPSNSGSSQVWRGYQKPQWQLEQQKWLLFFPPLGWKKICPCPACYGEVPRPVLTPRYHCSQIQTFLMCSFFVSPQEWGSHFLYTQQFAGMHWCCCLFPSPISSSVWNSEQFVKQGETDISRKQFF